MSVSQMRTVVFPVKSDLFFVHVSLPINKMEEKKYHFDVTFTNSNRNIVKIGKLDIHNTYIHDHLLSWFGTGLQ